jgi:hypothetical protein
MARRMTPAQVRAALQKAQRDQKRAVDNYNREARKYNAAVKKAVNDYNREVRNYNSKARAHNRAVENQRRRLQQEMSRLRSRPASTTFVSYRTSTTAFVDAYSRAEASLATNPGSAVDQQFLDLGSDEAANSVYLANALDGDGDPDDAFTEDELRAPSMRSELASFGEDLVNRWVGALYALSPQNPDAARHFCTSAREVVIAMLDTSASDGEVKGADPSCELTDSGAVTRRSKIQYLLRRHGVTAAGITDIVSGDMDNLLSLFRTFNDGTHGHSGRFTISELSAIRTRVEAAIRFVHTVVAVPKTRSST